MLTPCPLPEHRSEGPQSGGPRAAILGGRGCVGSREGDGNPAVVPHVSCAGRPLAHVMSLVLYCLH